MDSFDSRVQDSCAFEALCPDELLKAMENPKITFSECMDIVRAIKNLGFFEVSTQFLLRSVDTVCEKSDDAKATFQKIIDEEVFLLNKGETRKEESERRFVEMFIENVKNKHLKKFFQERAESYYGK